MADGRTELLETLASHPWPAGTRVRVDGEAVRIEADPLGRTDVAVGVAVVVGIPAVVVALFPTIQGVVTAALFAIAVFVLGFQRFKGAQRVTIDLAGASVHVEHANPRIARRVGLPARTVGFGAVDSVDATRVLMGSRTEPHGRRVALRLDDDTSVILAEFSDAAQGLLLARAIAQLLDVPTREF